MTILKGAFCEKCKLIKEHMGYPLGGGGRKWVCRTCHPDVGTTPAKKAKIAKTEYTILWFKSHKDRDSCAAILCLAVNVEKIVTHSETNKPCHGLKFTTTKE